jgi:hypothetical protein
MRSCARHAVVALALVLVAAVPARANFHYAVIDEVMAGCGADPAVQFVEIRMTLDGQNVVGGSRLVAFSCDGSVPRRDLLLVDGNIGNSMAGGRWIMATPGFQAASGIAPDFPTMEAGIFPDCGQICWGKPGSNLNSPSSYVDCVAYGPYTGPPAPRGTPVAVTPNTGSQSLTRAGSGFNNFVLDAPTPTNAMGQPGNLGACTQVSSTTTTSGVGISSTTSTTTAGGGNTTTTIAAALLGGGAAKTDCSAAWRVVGVPETGPAVRCADDDGGCDQTVGLQGCRVRAQLCFNDAAAAVFGGKCAASPVTAFALTGNPDPQAAAAIATALQALPGAQPAGGGVSFAPPLAAFACTPPLDLDVPLKVKGSKIKKGSRTLKSVTTADKRDKDKLKILCIP